MARRTGYLANVLSVPPLIFKFQFNPELLSEKKSFTYNQTKDFGNWDFDKAKAAGGVFSTLSGAVDDVKELGSLLTGTAPMEADTGKPRTFALDFALDARNLPDIPAPQTGTPISGDARFGGRIEPSLAVLRSFMNPALDPFDVVTQFAKTKSFCPPTRPPACTLKLGDIDLECVMTDLNIKVTKFKADLTPERAEVSLTLTEQTRSISTGIDVLTRLVEVAKSFGQLSGEDWVQTVPGGALVQNIFS